MRSRNCTQVWCELSSEISVAFEILVKKLEAEDTEAYQEMMRINYKTFWEIPVPILVIMLCAILVWARFGKTADLTIIIHYPPLVQTTKTIMSNLNMSKLHDIWWNVMIEHDSLCSNALDSWNYRQLSWPFKRGFSFSFATMMKGNHSAHRFRINNFFFFRCRVWCQRRLKWYFIERYCELWFGKMCQSWKKRP